MRNIGLQKIRPLVRALGLMTVLVLAVSPVRVHGEEVDHSGFDQAYLGDFEELSRKIVGLAEEMPEEIYSWRPAEGVRSVSESYMHIASGTFFFASQLGVERPGSLPDGKLESIVDKSKVVEILKLSMEQIPEMVKLNASRDLDGWEFDLFGSSMSARRLYLQTLGHMHEHLGQAIAYARSNGVVPPWSRPASTG